MKKTKILLQLSALTISILAMLLGYKCLSIENYKQTVLEKDSQVDPPHNNSTNKPTKQDRQSPAIKDSPAKPSQDDIKNDATDIILENSSTENRAVETTNSTDDSKKSTKNRQDRDLNNSNINHPLLNSKRWTEIIAQPESSGNRDISIDFPYATTNNFVKTKLYSCSRCFLRPDVAVAIKKAHSELQKQGYGLKLFDCYRPHKVQYKMWKIMPDERYVGNPKKGSDHNRGIAVDLTIVDRNGKPLDMGTPFDDFSPKAHHNYRKLPPAVIKNRLLLKNTMASVGFHGVNTEWWHYAWNTGKKPDIEQDEWNCSQANAPSYPKSDRSPQQSKPNLQRYP